ncbi:hypothetical protein Q5741_13115 [Paenibacillus sp. JX-17]|uniref:Lipoprotein n=1 Tax=Paenibacillus lacisoli TaxID=3064525 RepID=A0ABT9CI46_9BACL|nr:hypothetical protein [Paenibacillus sp. JX-17]MDO7907346.1 hypothetical protein [Paenibacillus sp. JX-17]
MLLRRAVAGFLLFILSWALFGCSSGIHSVEHIQTVGEKGNDAEAAFERLDSKLFISDNGEIKLTATDQWKVRELDHLTDSVIDIYNSNEGLKVFVIANPEDTYTSRISLDTYHELSVEKLAGSTKGAEVSKPYPNSLLPVPALFSQVKGVKTDGFVTSFINGGTYYNIIFMSQYSLNHKEEQTYREIMKSIQIVDKKESQLTAADAEGGMRVREETQDGETFHQLTHEQEGVTIQLPLKWRTEYKFNDDALLHGTNIQDKEFMMVYSDVTGEPLVSLNTYYRNVLQLMLEQQLEDMELVSEEDIKLNGNEGKEFIISGFIKGGLKKYKTTYSVFVTHRNGRYYVLKFWASDLNPGNHQEHYNQIKKSFRIVDVPDRPDTANLENGFATQT